MVANVMEVPPKFSTHSVEIAAKYFTAAMTAEAYRQLAIQLKADGWQSHMVDDSRVGDEVCSHCGEENQIVGFWWQPPHPDCNGHVREFDRCANCGATVEERSFCHGDRIPTDQPYYDVSPLTETNPRKLTGIGDLKMREGESGWFFYGPVLTPDAYREFAADLRERDYHVTRSEPLTRGCDCCGCDVTVDVVWTPGGVPDTHENKDATDRRRWMSVCLECNSAVEQFPIWNHEPLPDQPILYAESPLADSELQPLFEHGRLIERVPA